MLDEHQLFAYRDGWNEWYNSTSTIGNVPGLYQRDSLMVPIVSWIIVGAYFILVPVLTVLVVMRRKYQPIVSRNWVVILVTLYSQLLLIVATILRLAIGRWRFPCLFYSFGFALLPPFVYLPAALKMWRLFFVFRVSQLKTRIAGYKRTSQRKSLSVFKGFIDQGDRRRFWFQHFAASSAFTIVAYIFFLILHIILWFVLSFSLFKARDLFNMQYSCGAGLIITIVVAICIFSYIIMQGVFLIVLYAFKVRDRWGIRLESTITCITWLVFMIVTAALNVLYDYIYVEGERFMAVAFYAMIACFVDLIVSVIIPVIRSFFTHRVKLSSVEEGTSTDQTFYDVMADPELRNLFKDFCTESLSVEPVCFIEDVLAYKDESKVNNNELINMAYQIIEKFLRDDSPLLLNLPNKKRYLSPIEEKLKLYDGKIAAEPSSEFRFVDVNLFEEIEVLCLQDLRTDTFSRFTKTAEYASFLKERKKFEMKKVQVGLE